MYYFCVTYDDGKFIECDNITSVSYSGFDHQVVVQGDEVGSHRYPLKKDLWAVQEKLLAQADADGFTAWELAELAAWAEAWT